LIFIGAVAVEPLTLISMMSAAAAGAAWGARHVVSFDRQTIRLVMAISLLVVAGLIFAGLLDLFPVGGDAMGLSGDKLAIALFGVFSTGTFIRKGALDAKAVLAVAIFGPIGLMLVAMLVKSMDMVMLTWLVAFVVIYTSWTMDASWRATRRSPG